DPADFFVPAKELNIQHYLNFVNKATLELVLDELATL
ncbi:hypothetical protein TorRG33x02_204760, partial [Trema orientale]